MPNPVDAGSAFDLPYPVGLGGCSGKAQLRTEDRPLGFSTDVLLFPDCLASASKSVE